MNPAPSLAPTSHCEARIPGPAAKVGLIAGWGRYPIVVARALRAQGVGVYCLGIKDHVDPAIRQVCDEFDWIGLAQIGKVIRYFRRHGVTVPFVTVPTDAEGEPIHTPGGGWFWPEQAFKDLVVSMILFAVLLAAALDWSLRRARPMLGVFALAIAASIVLQVVGAFAFPSSWNLSPRNVDRAHERLWDWTDTEISRCLKEGLKSRGPVL